MTASISDSCNLSFRRHQTDFTQFNLCTMVFLSPKRNLQTKPRNRLIRVSSGPMGSTLKTLITRQGTPASSEERLDRQ